MRIPYLPVVIVAVAVALAACASAPDSVSASEYLDETTAAERSSTTSSPTFGRRSTIPTATAFHLPQTAWSSQQTTGASIRSWRDILRRKPVSARQSERLQGVTGR